MTTITANITAMFSDHEPCYVSGSQMELGLCAAELTWRNALAIAERHASWLASPLPDAVEGMRDWARGCGAWDASEIAGWTDVECLAMFVQNIAGELRECLDADNRDLHDCAALYEQTDWEAECQAPVGYYYVPGPKAPFADVHVVYYAER